MDLTKKGTPTSTSLPGGPTATPAAIGPSSPPSQPYAAAPPMSPDSEITWSTLAHLSWILGTLFGGLTILGPVIAWFVLKDRGRFVRHHAAEALNANLSYLIYTLVLGAASFVFTVITFGIGFASLLAPIAVAGVGIVFSIVAAVSASRGAWYRYPLIIRFAS